MAKELIDACVMPKPLTPVATGKPAADAAIAKLAAWEQSAYSPVDTPSGKAYAKAVKAANAAPKAKLLVLLDDAACDLGNAPFDEARVKRLSPAKKKAYQKAYEAALHAGKAREGFLRWLMAAVLPDGRKRLLEIATTKRYPPAVRVIAAQTLVEHTDKAAELLAIGKALDPHTWDAKRDADDDLERIYVAGAQCWHAADPKKAYAALADLVTPAATKTEAGARRAAAVIDSLDESSDPRWAATVAAVVKGKLELDALPALAELPPDPAVIEPLLAYLGKPDKVTFWHDDAVKVLARVADQRVLPYLVAALHDSWMHYPAAFEGFERAGDPAMIPVIREWLVENATADRTKEANAIIKKLAKRGPIPEGAAEAAKPVKQGEPAPERPVLVFEKTKAFKAPKLDPIDKQETDFAKLFADAGIPEAAAILQRAVVMIPKRVDETTLALGETKLGGHPDLPAATPWPRVAKEPLTFLAQLNLAAFASHLPEDSPLPKVGLLAFFVDNNARTGSSYLEHARVILTEPGATLERREVPDDFVDRIFQACSVRLASTISLPSPNNAHVTKTLKPDVIAKYEADVHVDLDALPQVMGYRNHGYDAEEKATAQMLLQLTGDDQSDMEFGDGDYLSFFIDAKALAKGDFKKVWPKIGD